MASEVLTALEAEWQCLARSSRARRAVTRWTATHPVLTGLKDLADVLERRKDRRAAPAILAALARLAPNDELAARTLLHALVPGLVRLAQLTARDDPRALDEMMSIAWERIRTFPTHRDGSVAANVLLDVRQRYRKHRLVEAPKSIPVDSEMETTGRSAEDEAIGRLLFRQLVDGRRRLLEERRGVVSDRLWRLIFVTHYLGVPLSEIARREGVSQRSLSKRRWRAEQRLQRELPIAV